MFDHWHGHLQSTGESNVIYIEPDVIRILSDIPRIFIRELDLMIPICETSCGVQHLLKLIGG